MGEDIHSQNTIFNLKIMRKNKLIEILPSYRQYLIDNAKLYQKKTRDYAALILKLQAQKIL